MDNADDRPDFNYNDGAVSSFDRQPMWQMPVREPLTKRERFAMAAMQGLCANPYSLEAIEKHTSSDKNIEDVVAALSRQHADALLTELND